MTEWKMQDMENGRMEMHDMENGRKNNYWASSLDTDTELQVACPIHLTPCTH